MTNQILTLAQQLDKFRQALKNVWQNEPESKSKRRKIMALQRAIEDTRSQMLTAPIARGGNENEQI